MPTINTYPPIGRKGYYSYETVELGGTRYTWKPNQDRWEISGGSAFNDITGGRLTGGLPGTGVTSRNDRERLPSGEFVGGFYNQPKGITKPVTTTGDIITFSNYQFILKTTTKKGRVLVNGVDKGNANQVLQFTKSDILTGGDKRIKVTQPGYTSNEEYIISSETVLGTPNPNPYITTQRSGYPEITGAVNVNIVVKKYVNGQIVSYNGQNGSAFMLDFDLKQIKLPNPIDIQNDDITDGGTTTLQNILRIELSGDADGVVLLKNNVEEIPLRKGGQSIKDDKGTKFQFRVRDGYEIDDLDIQELGTKRSSIFRRKDTRRRDINPSATIVLNVNTTLWVSVRASQIEPDISTSTSESTSEEITSIGQPIVPDGPEPKISLLNRRARQHDIKDKSGLPISFRKNEEVEAVTVFVGKKHYVFDNLGDGPVAGIVIPSSAFKTVGRAEVRIIPYDLDELDDTIEQITRSEITRTKEIVEERIVEVRRPVPTPIEVEDRIEIRIPPARPPKLPLPPLPPKPPKPPKPPIPFKPDAIFNKLPISNPPLSFLASSFSSSVNSVNVFSTLAGTETSSPTFFNISTISLWSGIIFLPISINICKYFQIATLF